MNTLYLKKMNNYRIATPNDIETIANLHALSWQNSYRGMLSDDYLDNHVLADRIQVWTQKINEPPANQIIFVKEIDNIVVGFVCAYGSQTDEFGTFIDNLHVLPSFKGRGIGRDLMQEVSDWSLQHFNQPKLYLKVLEDNHSARFFYEKVGGEKQALFSDMMPGGNNVRVWRCVWKKFQPI
ncbi:GNAT family N-acetyltransferase [Runella salmonicolor]|uniref:GNAT family N-acetyltransferase n=1 Tax=Runella salmonicolor TaxID=2950278 RepID=A0ABT1FU41_9BACT|nr:GNAT family N-acetyltransferase [Runella salmonicolor]MCP1385283.1 GNAT family N-acetyltransferase [Runella salmonicolor]